MDDVKEQQSWPWHVGKTDINGAASGEEAVDYISLLKQVDLLVLDMIMTRSMEWKPPGSAINLVKAIIISGFETDRVRIARNECRAFVRNNIMQKDRPSVEELNRKPGR